MSTPLNVGQKELASCYIALYFYTAQTNFWAQFCLKDANEFDPESVWDAFCKRIVDMSASDFDYMAKILMKTDRTLVNSSVIYHLLDETKSQWKNLVFTVSEIYEKNAKSQ